MPTQNKQLDFEIKLPQGYLSYSQLRTYLYDPREYYEIYYLGKDIMEELKRTNIRRWEKIKLGSIFQDAWYNPMINWRKILKKEGFTPDKERIIETALKDPQIIKMPMKNCEQKYTTDIYGIRILIKPDGFDKGKRLLIENKFGATRTQDYVDNDLQLSFYSLAIKKIFNFIPKIILQSINDKNGRVKLIETKRDKSDLDFVAEQIVNVARGISRGEWQKEEEH